MATFDTDHPIIRIGSAPIPGDAPAGEAARDDPDFEAVLAQIDVMKSEGPKAVKWPEVVEKGIGLLETKTKDLFLGVYVCFGLYQEKEIDGLAVGLGMLSGLLSAHWDDMQPPKRRERARVNAMEWLAERLAPHMANTKVGPESWDAIIVSYSHLSDIDQFLSEKLQKNQANLGDFFRTLREKARDAKYERKEAEKQEAEKETKKETATVAAEKETDNRPTPACSPPAASPPPAETPTAASTAAVVPPQVTIPPTAPPTAASKAEVDRALRSTLTSLQTFARQLRESNLSDPRPYILSRVSAWMNVRQAPPNEDGQTMLPAPPADSVRPIDAAVAANNHGQAIALAETAFADKIFWLDPHRVVATALQALGPQYDPAYRVVVGQVTALLTRVPGLPLLRFAGGRPFADDRTRIWLEEDVLASGGDDRSDSRSGGEEAGLTEAIAEGKKLAVAGKLQEGLDQFDAGRRSASSARSRFLWELAQARFCLDTGSVGLALPVLRQLSRQISGTAFEAWEPALCFEVNALLYKAYTHPENNQPADDELKQKRISELQDTLCLLDLGAAARLLSAA